MIGRKKPEDSRKHLHLAAYGFTECGDKKCPLPVAGPEDDAICAGENCEGGCPAAKYSAWRRKDL